MSPAPHGKDAPPKATTLPLGGRRWFHLPERKARQRLTITIQYTGGAEAAVHVTARGSAGVFPGHAQLIDVVAELNCWSR